jgi:hypothetical protein
MHPSFRLALTSSLLAFQLDAQAPTTGPSDRAVQAVRITQAPRIDARLIEDIWRTAPVATGFIQREPEEGIPNPENTEVRFAYDDEALYVGLRMFSKVPANIRALVTRRDNETSSEMSCVSMDTYRDRRTAYSFCITPAGVRLEFYHASDDVDDGDEDWNPVWDASARIDSAGWTAEMRIPFSQLRFSKASVQDWGLNLLRYVPARNEESYWVLVKRTENGWSSRMGSLTGISGVRPSRRIEALPYIAADSRSAAHFDPADPFNKQYTNRARFGGDMKMGLGSNLTLDMTVNPDFGQVEADPAVVNLSAYETFFDERRPFFLEGADLLNQRNLFYSRRIGAPPPGSGSGDYVERLANTTILGAAKLTGQLRPGLSIAALGALTDHETVRTFDSAASPQLGRTLVAPRTGYAVASVRQLFGKNASTLSALVSAVHRDVKPGDALASLLTRDAYSALLDGRLRWAGGKYDFNAFVAFTNVRGDTAAILRQQLSSRRYYQRPDADHVEVDPTRRSLSGTIFNMSHSKMSGAHWLWDIDYQQTSPGFEPNDMGRSGGVDNTNLSMNVRWRQTKPSKLYRRWEVGTGASRNWNFGGLTRPGSQFVYTDWTLPNFFSANVELSYRPRALDDRLTRGGPVMGTPSESGWSLELDSPDGKRTSWSLDLGHSWVENGGWGQEIGTEFNFQPSDRLEISVEPRWERGADARQYLTSEATANTATYNTRYVFGRVDLSEISSELRLNFTFTPNLTLETVVQPFAASGRFSGFGELSAPGSRDLRVYGTSGTTITKNVDGSHTVDDGAESFDIDNEDFNDRSLRTNAVVRWEWRPGSTLFLVWQQSREHERPFGDARPSHLAQAFGAKADNFFALKVSYWIPVR